MSGDHGRSYDVYRIVPQGGDKPVRHTRVTTIADTLDDRSNLERWGQRMVALGLNARPDLLSLVSVTDPSERGVLNKICEDAKEAAAGSAKANTGTALHKLTERVDAGEQPPVPPGFRRDLDAYRTLLAAQEIEVLPQYIERVCVNGNLGEPVAGTVDRIVRWRDGLFVTDLKTGLSLDYSWRKIAVQLACYAHADSLYDAETETHEPMPAVSREHGIVFHLPAGSGECTSYLVDLDAGWFAAKQSVAVRNWRKRKDLATRITGDEAA